MKKYFYVKDGASHGPLSAEELVEAGVAPDTLVWCKGMDEWLSAGDVPELSYIVSVGVQPEQLTTDKRFVAAPTPAPVIEEQSEIKIEPQTSQ